jgi:oligopeptide transport system substrate-binding protein
MRPGKKFTRGFLTSFFGLLALLLAACGGGATTPQTSGPARAPDSQQIFVSPIGGSADITTFDPALASDIPSIQSVDMVFTGLVTLDDKLEIHNQLAESYQVGPDGLTWTFKLKPNLKFSDGTPLTSKDVAYSIDRALQPATKSGSAPFYLGLIKDSDKLNNGQIKTIIGDSVMTPDDDTVVIVTNKKAAYFLDTLTYPSSYVVEKSLIDKYGADFVHHLTEGGGDGPWKVSRYQPGQDIEFVPNPNYYGPKPQLRKVVEPFYAVDATVYKDYQVNRVDESDFPTDVLEQVKNLPNHQFHQFPLLAIDFLGLNYLTKPFDNIKIRQAFALAINKDLIAKNIYKGTLLPTNHIVPQGMPGYNPNLTGPAGVKGTSGDPQLAKQLLQQGMQEEGLTLATFPPVTLHVANLGDPDTNNAHSALQQMWQSVLGVNVKIEGEDRSKFFADVDAAAHNPKGYQMWASDWYADYPDPQDWITLLFSPNATKNSENYGQNNGPYNAEQQANQRLMQQADVNLDFNSRMQQYNQIEQNIVNDVGWIPEFQVENDYLLKPCVAGIVDNAQALTPPDDWGAIYKTTAQPCANTSRYQ